MRRVYKVCYVALSVWFVSACGGGGGGGGGGAVVTEEGEENGTIVMVVGKPYIVEEDDRIVRKEENSVLETQVDMRTKTTTVILKSGRAELIKE